MRQNVKYLHGKPLREYSFVLLPADSQRIEWNEDPAQHVRHGQGDDDQIKPLNI